MTSRKKTEADAATVESEPQSTPNIAPGLSSSPCSTTRLTPAIICRAPLR